MRTVQVPERNPGPRVLVVSGSVGAGHDGVARELAARLTAAGADVAVRDFLEAVPRPVAFALREVYAGTVAHLPLTFEVLFRRLEHRGLSWRAEQAVCHRAQPAVLGWVESHRADVVVATYPGAAQTIGALRSDGRLAARAITYLTDPAVHVSWLHPGVDRHLTATSATARHGAAEYGLPLQAAGALVAARVSRRRGAGAGARAARGGGPPRAAPLLPAARRGRGRGAAPGAEAGGGPPDGPAGRRLARARRGRDHGRRRHPGRVHRSGALRAQRGPPAAAAGTAGRRRPGLADGRGPADAGRRRARAERRRAVVHRVPRGRAAGGDLPPDPGARTGQRAGAGRRGPGPLGADAERAGRPPEGPGGAAADGAPVPRSHGRRARGGARREGDGTRGMTVLG